MSNRQPPSNDELEVAEAKNPLVDLLYDYTAQAVTSRIGNYVCHRFDAGLAIVEKTAKWSLPQPPPSTEEDSGKTTFSAPPLVRPLPWILFLPALIALRLLRYSLSFVALLIGKQPVYPITMVSFLQNRRRKLRALKHRGQKLQRMKQAEKEIEQEAEQQQANTWLRRITLPLRYIICLRAVRPETTINQRDHHHHHHHRHHHHHQRPAEQPAGELADVPATDDGSKAAEPRDRSATKKRNAHERDADDSESSFEEATVQELLEKYASAEGDSSFHESDASSADSSSDISDSDKSHEDATVIDNEKNDPKKIKKESNGHAASNGKEPESESMAEKPQEPKQRSSLNATPEHNNKPEEKLAEPAPENGNVASKKESNEDKPIDGSQKPQVAAESEDKPANRSNQSKEQSPEDASSRNENQNSAGKQSPASMKEVKTNFQQKNKQQQQHQPNQPQQQQHTAANGGGGGGRKHKKAHHHNAQHN